VTINNGYRMRAWYDILGMDLVLREDEAGLRLSQGAVEELLEREKKRAYLPAASCWQVSRRVARCRC
jgi:phospholipase/carboxylesterase